jgi:hypothetical protein
MLIGLTAATCAFAGDNQPIVKATTKDDFAAVVAAVHQQMGQGGRWQYIDNRGRETIDGRFADMQALFNQYGSVDKMDSTAQVRLYNDQEAVNDILTRDDANRKVCHEEEPIGTHIPQRVCRTYGEIAAERQNAGQFIHEHESPGARAAQGTLQPNGH